MTLYLGITKIDLSFGGIFELSSLRLICLFTRQHSVALLRGERIRKIIRIRGTLNKRQLGGNDIPVALVPGRV